MSAVVEYEIAGLGTIFVFRILACAENKQCKQQTTNDADFITNDFHGESL
jgi:hypothetical protein